MPQKSNALQLIRCGSATRYASLKNWAIFTFCNHLSVTMKRIKPKLLWIFLIFISVDCFCQTTILDSTKEKFWYRVRTTGFYPPFDFQYATSVLKMGAPVIKNNKSYVSLLSTNDSNFSLWDTIGFLRESNHQVYYLPILKDSDYILYDFNLGMSSTIDLTIDYSPTPVTFIVNKIDSVIIGGVSRKRISFGLSLVWIEGIGSLQGLLYNRVGVSGARYELSCYSEDGNIIYHNPTYADCFCITTIRSIEQNNNLYSVNGSIYLTDYEESVFELLNLSGVRIMKQNINNSKSVIDISTQKSGVYLYKIISHRKTIIGKLIKD